MLGACFILTRFQLCFGDALLGGQKSRARPLLGFATVGLLGVSEETFFFSLAPSLMRTLAISIHMVLTIWGWWDLRNARALRHGTWLTGKKSVAPFEQPRSKQHP